MTDDAHAEYRKAIAASTAARNAAPAGYGPMRTRAESDARYRVLDEAERKRQAAVAIAKDKLRSTGYRGPT